MAAGRSNIHPTSGMPARVRTMSKLDIDARLSIIRTMIGNERFDREIDELLANRYLLDHPERV